MVGARSVQEVCKECARVVYLADTRVIHTSNHPRVSLIMGSFLQRKWPHRCALVLDLGLLCLSLYGGISIFVQYGSEDSDKYVAPVVYIFGSAVVDDGGAIIGFNSSQNQERYNTAQDKQSAHPTF